MRAILYRVLPLRQALNLVVRSKHMARTIQSTAASILIVEETVRATALPEVTQP